MYIVYYVLLISQDVASAKLIMALRLMFVGAVLMEIVLIVLNLV